MSTDARASSDTPPSYWWRQGERLGHALAYVLFGPAVALEMRARRRARQAVLGYCATLESADLGGPRRRIHRSVQLPARGRALSVELDVDVIRRRASFIAVIDPLPGYVQATVRRAPWRLTGTKMRLGKALALQDGVRVDSANLNVPMAEALLDAVAAGPLGRVEAFELSVGRECLELTVLAPSTVSEWQGLGEGLVLIEAWLGERWRAGYRS
jgi:hypothetical protein